MKRDVLTTTITTITTATLLAIATTAFAQSAPAAKPAAAPAGKIENGGVLYKKVGCYQCHANEAQGGLSGPRIGPNLVPFARFSQYTRKPTGEMPPYSAKVLSDQEIADIYAWVNARPRPPAVDTLPQLRP
jgi:ubiquinol-cytochrome c reductase cytochrome c subunit